MGPQSLGDAGQCGLVVGADRRGGAEVGRVGEFQPDEAYTCADVGVETHRSHVQIPCGASLDKGGFGSARRAGDALHKYLSRSRLKMLMQQPDCEALKYISGDEIVA